MVKKALVKEIVEQICASLVLKQGKLDLGTRLALIILDNAVELTLKSYASYHHLLKGSNIDSQQVFSSVLNIIKDQNKIVNSEEKDIKKYHGIRSELYHGTNLTAVKDSSLEEYVVLAKILLARLYDFRVSKLEWEKMVNDMRRSLTKAAK